MKYSFTYLYLIATLFLVSACNNAPDTSSVNESNENMEKAEIPQKVLRHVVMFKWKEGTTAEKLGEIEGAFKALPSKIPQIKDFEWGLNNSPEGLDKGFTHVFFLTFASEEDRAIYLPHPDHKAFGNVLGESLDDVMVLDYWVTE